MPKVREESEQALRLKFKKVYGREPSVPEFQQFKKNRPQPYSDDEFNDLPESEASNDHPYLRSTHSSFARRRNENRP